MDIERLLLGKIIESGELGPAAEANITAEWFADPESAKVWTLITEHKAKYQQVPSVGAVKHDYPTYRLLASDEDLPYLVDEMRRHRHLVLQEAAITDAANLVIARKPEKVTERMHGLLADIAKTSGTTTDINLAANGSDRLIHYKELSELDGRLRGIPTGFPAIDNALQGAEPGQLYTFVGPPKAGKSTSVLLMAKAANDTGYEPLFVGFEMSNKEQFERLDAFRAGISHARLRNGTLTSAEWKKLERAVKAQANLPDFHMTQDSSSVMTLSGLRAKIEKFEPDIVYVDGVYMMTDEMGQPNGSPQALTNITRGMKRLAQQLEVPIIITTQALESKMNGKKLSTYSIGYSSSFVQDSDAIIGVERTDEANIMKMKLMLARNAQGLDVFYSWNWDPTKFEELDYNPFEADDEKDIDKYGDEYGWAAA
ncbi:DnaB-like helicase C-terminal domain-containing protein [Nonomuraea jabiensis]|uniref:DnaB-like helicase C-terminal domain-containing protein n=1 Tax=Nonomuraea jabiensis TaxID=882448 RepID=UPI0034226078